MYNRSRWCTVMGGDYFEKDTHTQILIEFGGLKFCPLHAAPVHPWYQSKYPGGFLVRGSSRRDQNALTRFLSGHLMSLTFVDVVKHFEICIKGSSAQGSPGHILSCLGLTRQDLVQDPLLVLDFFRVNGHMDLI
ncbi:uncharacterized protein TNCV_3811531 [Trichonephila clavipes]|nr:uncharacterized protein TNCV_3811531 [Trichonephila clavipes]